MKRKNLISCILAASLVLMTGCSFQSDGAAKPSGAEGAATEAVEESENGTETNAAGTLTAEDPVVTLVPKDAEPDEELSTAVQEAESNGASVDQEYKNIRYASQSTSQVCDIKLPEGDGKFPVILVIHGGGFMLGSKDDPELQSIIDAAIAHGYATVNAEYRGYDEANFPGALSDIKGLVRFIKANADQYRLDPENITVWGASAGGYLAAMTALTANVGELSGDVTDHEGYVSDVKALVDFYGPIHFTETNADFEEIGISPEQDTSLINFETAYLGFDMNTDLTRADKSWWGTYIDQLPDDFDIKVWISHGTGDNSIPYTQSVHFASDLKAVLPEEHIHLELFDGADHAATVYYQPENLEKIFQYLGNGND